MAGRLEIYFLCNCLAIILDYWNGIFILKA